MASSLVIRSSQLIRKSQGLGTTLMWFLPSNTHCRCCREIFARCHCLRCYCNSDFTADSTRGLEGTSPSKSDLVRKNFLFLKTFSIEFRHFTSTKSLPVKSSRVSVDSTSLHYTTAQRPNVKLVMGQHKCVQFFGACLHRYNIAKLPHSVKF